MECRIERCSLQLTGSCNKHIKTYAILYTCQRNINKLGLYLERNNNANFINHLVQTRLKSRGDEIEETESLNWKIKTKCFHLTEGDFNWISKISHLQNIHLATSELLNWLSTLGGELSIVLLFLPSSTGPNLSKYMG